MNEEKYILARLVVQLRSMDKRFLAEKGFNPSWNAKEIMSMIEILRAEAVLGDADSEEEVLPWES